MKEKLTLNVRYVREVFGVAAVSRLFPLELQEDGDGPLQLGGVVRRRLEHDGVLRKEGRKEAKVT